MVGERSSSARRCSCRTRTQQHGHHVRVDDTAQRALMTREERCVQVDSVANTSLVLHTARAECSMPQCAEHTESRVVYLTLDAVLRTHTQTAALLAPHMLRDEECCKQTGVSSRRRVAIARTQCDARPSPVHDKTPRFPEGSCRQPKLRVALWALQDYWRSLRTD